MAKGAAPLWMLLMLALLCLAAALAFGPIRSARGSALEQFWSIQILAMDQDAGWLVLRISDFNAMVEAYNRQVDVIRKLREGKGCT